MTPIHAPDLATTARDHAARAWAERLEYELRGAYRAGYACVYVGHPRAVPHDSGTFAFTALVIPSYGGLAPADYIDDADRYRWECYDLAAVDPAAYRAAVRGER